MKTPTASELLTLAAIDRMARVERSRSDWWELLPLRDRQRAMGVAGMTKEQAAQPLASFTDAERRQIALAISQHCGQMELVAQCMSGGPSRVLH
ncbi:MAG: hypothetical protein ACXW2U_00825 [Telluria sp.]